MNRRDALTGVAAIASAMAATGQAEASPAWPEAIFNLKDGKTTHEPFGDLTVFLDGHTKQLKTMVAGTLVLKPGMEPHPPHQHPEEEIMLVTDGRGEILVGGKTHEAGPGALMFSGPNQLHGVKNTGSAPFRFYYFKWSA